MRQAQYFRQKRIPGRSDQLFIDFLIHHVRHSKNGLQSQIDLERQPCRIVDGDI